jgi:hypothetical protein
MASDINFSFPLPAASLGPSNFARRRAYQLRHISVSRLILTLQDCEAGVRSRRRNRATGRARVQRATGSAGSESWKREAGSRKPEAGSWKLEAGSWKPYLTTL